MANTRGDPTGDTSRTLVGRIPAQSLLGLAGWLLVGCLAAVGLASCQVITAPLAADAMNVSYEIQYFQAGQTHISIGFTDAKLNPVEFTQGQTVACNGTYLRYDRGRYIGDVAKQPSTGTYTLTYTPSATSTSTSGGSSSPVTVSVKVLDATVVVTQPASGATVPIPTAAPLTIQYQPVTLADTSISALANDGRAHFTFTLPQTESGAIAMPADNFSSFQGGPGTLTITRETVAHPAGTGFRTVDTHFKNITQVPITWQ